MCSASDAKKVFTLPIPRSNTHGILSPYPDILRDAGQEPNPESTSRTGGSTYKQIFKLKAMPLLIIWALIYIGVEVTLGGAFNIKYILRDLGLGAQD